MVLVCVICLFDTAHNRDFLDARIGQIQYDLEHGFVEHQGKFCLRGTCSWLSTCSLIKLLLSNLLLVLLVNNPTHTYLSDLRVYFKVELYSE